MQTLEQLEKFASPGRIVFREDELSPVAVLVSPYGAAEVALYGAHVLSYRLTGHAPLLWLAASYKGIKQGEAIRGGIPVCWPWFGPSGKQGLPSHGFVRTLFWSVTGTETDKDSTAVTLSLVSSPETLALWPHDFRLNLTVTVGKTLDVELETVNDGKEPFAITEALHSYFSIKDISDILVTGLDGEPYIERAPGGADSVQSGAIAFSGETDRIYPRHSGSSIINDNGAGRRIFVGKDGSAATVVWNPWTAKAARLGDIAGDEWRRFVCVETANAGGEPITVNPGESHKIVARLAALLSERK